MRTRDGGPARAATAALLVLLLPGRAAAQGPVVQGVVREGGPPVAGAVVSLEALEVVGGGAPAASPGEGEPPVIDQRSLRFEPGVIAVQPGTRVAFINSDPILHNVFSPGWTGEAFDLGTYPSGTSRSHVFTELGPHVILCHVHPEMAAYVVVVPTPHHAVTDAEGRFAVRGVSPGRYRLVVWRRGDEPRDQALTVPDAGRPELVLDLSGGDALVRGGGR